MEGIVLEGEERKETLSVKLTSLNDMYRVYSSVESLGSCSSIEGRVWMVYVVCGNGAEGGGGAGW